MSIKSDTWNILFSSSLPQLILCLLNLSKTEGGISTLPLLLEVKVKVAQSCPTLCDPMDYIVHEILQARILRSAAFPFSRGSSQPRDRTQVSCIAGGFFTSWATREAQEYWSGQPIPSPGDLPNPEIEPGSPALQADSIPTELPGKPPLLLSSCHFLSASVIVLVLHISQLSCSAQKTSWCLCLLCGLYPLSTLKNPFCPI